MILAERIRPTKARQIAANRILVAGEPLLFHLFHLFHRFHPVFHRGKSHRAGRRPQRARCTPTVGVAPTTAKGRSIGLAYNFTTSSASPLTAILPTSSLIEPLASSPCTTPVLPLKMPRTIRT